ncbi:MAG: NADH-quinone oxidoreductase subunit F, partial [Victivallales bacterium]|nr:NADH-quinone oxidoreductase subunit F [Victivallales bacterium]
MSMEIAKNARRIVICAGTGCVASGALAVHDAFVEAAAAHDIAVVDTVDAAKAIPDGSVGLHLTKSGCQGFCQMGPLVTVYPDNILYTCVRAEDAPEIVAETLVAGKVVERLLYREPNTGQICKGEEEIPFYAKQQRTILGNCGVIDPENLDEYIAWGGYDAARTAFTSMAPEEVCQVVADAGLRGRGGGGFPTGLKWQFTLKEKRDKKYVICNGDEGDPGAFMDRSLMEGNPHRVLEGMMV